MSLIRIEKAPSGRQLTVFALAWLLVLALAGSSARSHGHPRCAEILWAAAAALPIAGAASRPLVRAAYVGLSYATYPIGFVLSYVVLALVYFLVVTPIGLAMRLAGRDPLERKFDRRARSYWKTRKAGTATESYFRQG